MLIFTTTLTGLSCKSEKLIVGSFTYPGERAISETVTHNKTLCFFTFTDSTGIKYSIYVKPQNKKPQIPKYQKAILGKTYTIEIYKACRFPKLDEYYKQFVIEFEGFTIYHGNFKNLYNSTKLYNYNGILYIKSDLN
jgi:hypothetical protein